MTDEHRSDDVTSPPLSGRRHFLRTSATAALGAGALAGAAQTASSGKGASVSASMPTRPLGRTGVELPILHLGTSQDLDPVYDKVMHRSFKAGVTWFDTALMYGWGASHAAINTFLSLIHI